MLAYIPYMDPMGLSFLEPGNIKMEKRDLNVCFWRPPMEKLLPACFSKTLEPLKCVWNPSRFGLLPHVLDTRVKNDAAPCGCLDENRIPQNPWTSKGFLLSSLNFNSFFVANVHQLFIFRLQFSRFFSGNYSRMYRVYLQHTHLHPLALPLWSFAFRKGRRDTSASHRAFEEPRHRWWCRGGFHGGTTSQHPCFSGTFPPLLDHPARGVHPCTPKFAWKAAGKPRKNGEKHQVLHHLLLSKGHGLGVYTMWYTSCSDLFGPSYVCCCWPDSDCGGQDCPWPSLENRTSHHGQRQQQRHQCRGQNWSGLADNLVPGDGLALVL